MALLCLPLAAVFASHWSGLLHPANPARLAARAAVTTHQEVRKPQSAAPVLVVRRASVFRIVFFGDSLSRGFGASAPGHGYVTRVSTWLQKRGHRVIKTVDAKTGVPVAYWELALIPRQLDAAVVELGTNDVHLGTPAAQFAREYRTLTSRIRVESPTAQVLCLSVWSHPGLASLDDVINAQIKAVCPGTYVDITSLRDRPNVRASDGFHPNDLGYRLIAQAVVSKLGRRRPHLHSS